MQGIRGRIFATLGLVAAIPCTAPLRAEVVESYAVAEAVFLQRDNQSANQQLAANQDSGAAIISAGELQFPTQPGGRLFYGNVDECGFGWETGYLGVWNMFATRQVPGEANIRSADPLALLVDDFNDRSQSRATYASTLNTIEINAFARWDDGGRNQFARYPWQRGPTYHRGTWDWLAGFRWAGLEESAALTLDGGATPVPSSYSLRSSTNLFGMQLGGRGRVEWERWAIESWAKAALAGTALSQSQDPIFNAATPDPPVRSARSASEGGVGFIGDINATLVYKLSDGWALRAGYNLIWLSGVALAPNQFDFGDLPTSGTGLNGGAGLFLHGANLGVEARW
jgi:hypothetical protein